jgi:starch phosphorylase
MRARAKVQLGGLKPGDVAVQMYTGRLNATGEIVDAETTPMHLAGDDGKGVYTFESDPTPWRVSGLHGYTVRVLPAHAALHCNHLPGLITWAGGKDE